MKAINTGNIYRIYDNSLTTYDKLPPQVYSIRCSEMTGFFLEKHADIEIKESKIYGVHIDKVNKVLSSFKLFERSLGVILSGNRGIGKSLFAKLLSIKAIENGLPLIIVDKYISGIVPFIESIEQEAVFMFDEFEKTFPDEGYEGGMSPQAAMLSLFDGLAQGKKLFVVTCNEIRELNNYLINRPGRFHYHFRFEYPTSDDIKEYLQDKLDRKYWGEIDEVISFSNKVELNYDCLRAIAFELNKGESFKSAIKDLNIINIDSERYNVILHYDNGMTAKARNAHINLFDDSGESVTIYLCDDRGCNFVDVSFDPVDCVFDSNKMINVVQADDLEVEYMEFDPDEEGAKIVESAKNARVEYLSIHRKQDRRNIHYTV